MDLVGRYRWHPKDGYSDVPVSAILTPMVTHRRSFGAIGRRSAAGVVTVVVGALAVALAGCASAPVHGSLRAIQVQGANAETTPASLNITSHGPAGASARNSDAALVEPYAGRIPAFTPGPVAEPAIVLPGAQGAGLSRIPTEQPVAFLTIDDGWTKLPVAPALLRAIGAPVTLFLTTTAIQDNPQYFNELQRAGAVIEAHTITHPSLRGKSYSYQHHEICGGAEQLTTWFGRRPQLFRPPFGEWDSVTLRAAHDCGMRATLTWSETVDKGVVHYQVGNQIQRGDIILMHFRPAFADDFLAAMNAIHAAGLTPALLDDYVT